MPSAIISVFSAILKIDHTISSITLDKTTYIKNIRGEKIKAKSPEKKISKIGD